MARIAIVGAGFSGLGLAIRLKKAGVEDFVVYEQADEVGGTWRDNTYPGAACDVESHLYSFSFAPNPNWSHAYSPGWEIQEYLVDCADRFGIRAHIRFGEQVREAAWDEAGDRWRIETNRGVHYARVLAAGTGPLSEPAIPDLPGLASFRGKTFHSARWDHDYDLRGKRVAVVGTGASAIQFVPQIQPKVAHLALFQRTAPWIIPRNERAITGIEKWAFRNIPGARLAARAGIYLWRELFAYGFVQRPEVLKIAQRMALAHLNHQVKDRELRRKLRPRYTMGCKRILIANDYYPALTRPNVEVVASGVKEIGAEGVYAADGTFHPVDAILFGTGFQVTDMPIAHHVRGRGGRLLADAWKDGMDAYLGTAVAGFPNLFMLIGPNTGLGHNSMVYMIESQLNYMIDAVRRMERTGRDVFEVRKEIQDAYNEDLQRKMGRTVWMTGGCASWYLDARGRNTTLWPDYTWRFRARTRRFDAASYEMRAGAPFAEAP